MQHQMLADRDIARETARAFVRRAAVIGDTVHPVSFFRHAARDTRIHHVHHAAHGGRSEQQGGRPAQHLDPLRQQRVNDDRVIDRRVRYVDRTDTVGQHANAFALKAAQDRARCVRAEGRCGNARLSRQRLADRGAQLARQFLAGQDRCALQHVGLALPDGRGNDDLAGGGGTGRRGLRECGRGDQQRGAGEESIANHGRPSF
jgi:hypothetical protein